MRRVSSSSPRAGITRGGSKEVVYDGARIAPADPTRLFIDALTTDQWRAKKFHPVLAVIRCLARAAV